MNSVTEDLALICARPISQSDRERAALLLLDWTACASGALREPFGRKATGRELPFGDTSCIGRAPSTESEAAFHNGLLGNVLEMDDVDARAVLHAAPTVIPAALAVAQSSDAAPLALLDSIVRGYEATIRIGRAVGAGHYARFHTTATCGPFGAAVAACDLLGSDTVAALGLAGTQAAGLWQTRHEPDSDAKQVHAAHAAQVGVNAARLAQSGIRGPRTILEGEQGFFAAMCPDGDPTHVLADYDSWLIHQTTIKPYPACRHAHAAIDAALALREDWDGKPLTVETYYDALTFCDQPAPKTPLEAKFSIQHVVALALLRGAPTLRDFTADALKDADVVNARELITIVESSELTAAYPAHFGARIGDVLIRDAYGDPTNPMPREAVLDKASALMRWGGMQQEGAQTLIDATLALADGGDLKAYFGAWP